jgi:hypothetical protein
VPAAPASAAAKGAGQVGDVTEKVLKAAGQNRAHFFAFPAEVSTAEESKKRAAEFEAAQISTVTQWANWLRSHPNCVPSIAQFRVQAYKEKFLLQLGERPMAQEAGTYALMMESVPTPRQVSVTWLLYPGVSFAMDEVGLIVAVRITSPLPAAKP